MLFIKDINWINRDVDEGDFLISDGKNEICINNYGFHANVGDDIKCVILARYINNVCLVKTNLFIIARISDDEYFLCGVVKNGRKFLRVGEFLFELDLTFVGDVRDGDFVEIKASGFEFFGECL